VALPRGHALSLRAGDLYREIHAAVASCLQGLGVKVDRRADTDAGIVAHRAFEPGRPFLCFLDRDPEDLLLMGSKVVGSAQRRRAGAILQHGSVMLRTSSLTPELPGIWGDQGLGKDKANEQELRLALPREVGQRLRMPVVEVDWTDTHTRRAQEKVEQVYGRDEWTGKR
jgi:lipoate-protein ligase A